MRERRNRTLGDDQRQEVLNTCAQSQRAPMSLALLGNGCLRDSLAGRLKREWEVVGSPSTEVESAGPVIIVSAADTTEGTNILRTGSDHYKVPHIHVQGELDRVVIGPLVRPGVPGCARCLYRRRASNQHVGKAYTDLTNQYGQKFVAARSPLLTPLTTDTAAALVAYEVTSWATNRPVGIDRAVIMMDLGTLKTSVHRFLPDPFCPECGRLLDDGSEAARIRPRSHPKIAPGSPRTRDLAAIEPELLANYVDEETGLLNAIRPSGSFTVPSISTRLQLSGTTVREEGYGRAFDFRSARLTSIAEALERIGGMRPGGKSTIVQGSYRVLREHALDPKTLGLYPKERYEIEGFPFQRYHDDLELRWVWAYSFGRAEPVLVPESYAYYGTLGHILRKSEERPFVYEISNGCALGSCLEEAIIQGLLEIAERDAFLMTWYAQMSVPELDPTTAHDHRIGILLERIRHRTGYEVLIFNSTIEQRIPCFWLMAVDHSGDPKRPRTLCAGGSAIAPERGVVNALLELAPLIEWRLATYPENRERAQEMVKDSSLVQLMSDHTLLYGHGDAFSRFEFLLSQTERRTFAEFSETWRWPEHADVYGDLEEILNRYLRTNLDVVIVDQTMPEHRVAGFACVKVIVPGTLPMTFGHHARRVDGFSRLFDVPYLLGYRERPLAAADVNPHPHPFP